MERKSFAEVKSLAEKAGFSGHELKIILAIAHAESALNPSAITIDERGTWKGILQIEEGDSCGQDLMDAEQSFIVGRSISQTIGFAYWESYRKRYYENWM